MIVITYAFFSCLAKIDLVSIFTIFIVYHAINHIIKFWWPEK